MTRTYLHEPLLTLATAGADHRSDDSADVYAFKKPVNAEGFSSGSVQVIWASADHTDATVTVEVTNDPLAADASFIAKVGATVVTLGGAAGLTFIPLTSVTERWVRVKYAKGSNTAGTLSCHLTLKG